jgi:hypothetical protein
MDNRHSNAMMLRAKWGLNMFDNWHSIELIFLIIGWYCALTLAIAYIDDAIKRRRAKKIRPMATKTGRK